MLSFFRKRSFKVLGGILAVFIAVSVIPAGNTYIRNLLMDRILTPIQQFFSGGANYAADAFELPKSREELEDEVVSLRDENRRLQDMLIDYYEVKAQNKELSKFYEIKKNDPDLTLVTASVISRDPNENFYGFTLDKGSDDGVRKDDTVMTENGLIGRVSEVSGSCCRVVTVLSPDVNIGAVIKRTGTSGIINGSPALCDEGMTSLGELSAREGSEGDIVVTSGRGGIFPKNIKIGTVKEIKLDDITAVPMAVIAPFEDIAAVRSAVIVIDFGGKGDINKNEQNDKKEG